MENTDNKTCIERIEIKGLWGRFDVNWALHSDVNILVGENGTGKSTILLTLRALANDYPIFQKNILSKSINLFYKIAGVSKQVECRINHKAFSKGESGYGLSTPTAKELSWDYINTFDKDLFEKNEWDKKNKPFIKTHLDKELDELIDDYVDYQLSQTKKIINEKQQPEAVFAKNRYFIETINRFFKHTDKRVDEKENRLSFLLNYNTKLTAYDLSSGEKQLLIILLKVLCQDEKPTVLLMDEPEISLHLRWQDKLIEVIRELNPNCQVIIATHSPSLFSDGWNDRIFWMEDICKPIQELEKV